MSSSSTDQNVWPADQRLRELLLFYHAYGHEYHSPRGSFFDILRLSDDELERKHDYIQWLFPLTEASLHNSTVPVLDYQTIMIFRRHPQDLLRENVRLALMRMLWFYGFDPVWNDGRLFIEPIEGPIGKHRRWLRDTDHNHLRLSRIIRSLRIFGMAHEAEVLYRMFVDTNGAWGSIVSNVSLGHWKRSVEGDPFQKLNIEQRLKRELNDEDAGNIADYPGDAPATDPEGNNAQPSPNKGMDCGSVYRE
ncbi:hypothetical protein M434DRAFT_12281 [Hypoxylon sp. CO27-5]|nr:hypothetical protein M434DRAFT_12281 [Hypoxylon sp. CO27-5]